MILKRREDNKRDRDETQERELPIRCKHDHSRKYKEHNKLQNIIESTVDEAFDLIDIRVEP